MSLALSKGEEGFIENEIPVGSLITLDNRIVSSSFNMVNKYQDPTAHAEILSIRKATKELKSKYLNECSLYSTLEPCAMCAQAIAFSKIKYLYFAAYDVKFGAVENGVRVFHSTYNHVPEIYGGIMEKKAVELMQKFFIKVRKKTQHT